MPARPHHLGDPRAQLIAVTDQLGAQHAADAAAIAGIACTDGNRPFDRRSSAHADHAHTTGGADGQS